MRVIAIQTMPDTPPIHHRLLTAMAGGLDARRFGELALEVFGYQFTHNTPYQNFCTALGRNPGNVTRWQEVPAVTTDAFKCSAHPLAAFPVDRACKTFLTSGTTGDAKGQHHFPTLDLYGASILRAWQTLHLPRPDRVVMLVPHSDDAPQSSLSHMLSVLEKNFRQQGCNHITWGIGSDEKLNLPEVLHALDSTQPTAILGTALAFLHLFDHMERPLTMPAGSWAMETGGYKGSGRQLDKADLYRQFSHHLGLPPDAITNEYSMTELSSQFYTTGVANPHTGPDWTRVRVINPLTGADQPAGEPGYLVIHDLANLYSVSAIRTQDIAVRHHTGAEDANTPFTLTGRDPAALPRGCSRAADHHLRA